jgi:hypothetical protein
MPKLCGAQSSSDYLVSHHVLWQTMAKLETDAVLKRAKKNEAITDRISPKAMELIAHGKKAAAVMCIGLSLQ